MLWFAGARAAAASHAAAAANHAAAAAAAVAVVDYPPEWTSNVHWGINLTCSK